MSEVVSRVRVGHQFAFDSLGCGKATAKARWREGRCEVGVRDLARVNVEESTWSSQWSSAIRSGLSLCSAKVCH